MEELLPLISRHGYALLAAICFAEAVGMPLPAALALLTAGAVAAFGKLHYYSVIGVGFVSFLGGDLLLFFLGKATGWTLLGWLCRVSMNPESCILRSAEYFYRRGKQTLLFAKFLPGINTMSPPLAGSMKMPLAQFLIYDALGALLYVGAYSLAGFVFSDALRAITRGIRSAGFAVEIVLGMGVIAYIGYRVWLYRKYRFLNMAPRVPVEEVARRLQAHEAQNVIVADVRSHGYYDTDSERIAGSVRLEPNRLEDEIKNLPRDQEIYLYCT